MVTKNIILTVLAILVALSIPASRQLVYEIGADTAPELDVVALAAPAESEPIIETRQPAIAVTVPMAVAVQSSLAVAPRTSTSNSAPEADAEPAVVISEQPETVDGAKTESETSIAAKPENLIGVPKIVKLPGTASGFLVSQWLDVPADVNVRVKTLPAPSGPRPRMRAFPLAETMHSRFSTTISKRELTPVIPRALTSMPAARPVSLTENTRARNFEPVVTRRLLPQLAEPALAKPVFRSFGLSETTAATVSSTLSTRRLVPLLPTVANRSFELTDTIAANTALEPAFRMPMPLLPEPVITKPTVRTFSLTEMTAVKESSAVNSRPIVSYLSQAANIKPRTPVIFARETIATRISTELSARPLLSLAQQMPTRHFSAIEEATLSTVSSVVSARGLSPLIPQPERIIQKPVIRSFGNAETTATNVSSQILSRDLMPLLPNALRLRPLLAETTATFVTTALSGRDLQKLPEPPVMIRNSETAAVAKPAHSAVNSELTAVNYSPPRSQAPLLINGQTALNSLGIIPLPSEMIFSEAGTERSGGPSTESSIGGDKLITSKAAKHEDEPILITARNGFSADMLRPMSFGAPVAVGENEGSTAADGSYCDPKYIGPPIRFSQTAELRLDDLINQLSSRFGLNFIVAPKVGEIPLNVKAGSIPWTTLLRSQLFVSGVRARCVDKNTIELIENKSLPSLQDMAEVKTRFIKLKFLQRTSSGTVDLANRSQGGSQSGSQGGCGGSSSGGQSSGSSGGGLSGGGGGQGETAGKQSNNKFDKLIAEIEKILGIRSMTESSAGSGQGGGTGQTEVRQTNRSVTEIPGRNILVIKATEEEFDLINQIIALADRAPYQVVIKGLVYSANQDRLRDIGVQTTASGGKANGNTTGGIFGNTLGVGTLFDFSTIIGTFDFNVQATAFQQNGVISVKSRPFATVLDGLCTTLSVGTKLPIVIDGGLNGNGSVTILDASNNLAVTPYVIDDENGNPVAVTLELLLRANIVDSSITARGVPAVNSKEIQTQLLLGEDKTAILGGFTVDQDSKSVSKTPGLGDIPLIGELFKRRVNDSRINRLYFAISVSVIPYGEVIRPVDVPGATTDPPSITPEMKKRADKAEPKQVLETR